MLQPEEARKLWSSELRSGRWQQGRSFLRREEKYCCLGVACELALRDGVQLEVKEYDDKDSGVRCTIYGPYRGTLPLEVANWLGLDSSVGTLNRVVRAGPLMADALTTLNDHGATFEQIADIIDAGLLVLRTPETGATDAKNQDTSGRSTSLVLVDQVFAEAGSSETQNRGIQESGPEGDLDSVDGQ